MNHILLALLLAAVAVAAHAKPHRSAAAKAEFRRAHPCPATGKTRGACPGWVIDHRIGLCVGGKDAPENMMWMSVDAAKRKDRWECKPGWATKLAACEADLDACTR